MAQAPKTTRAGRGPTASANGGGASAMATSSATASLSQQQQQPQPQSQSQPPPQQQHHPLQKYREILVARSDGASYPTHQINEASRSAQPVGEPLDDGHDYMRSWTVKLGKAIKYNLGAGASDATNYLVRLPQGYSLRVRPHKDRRDRDGPFVFGHPLGPVAAFRSPAELALHVLWLLSASEARSDCSCRLCVRMVAESAAASGPSSAPASAPSGPSSGPVSSAAPIPAASSAPPIINPTPIAGSAALFRPWELVWYQHVTSTNSKGAWRLGIVLQLLGPSTSTATATPTTPSNDPVRLAPLGVTGLHPPELTLPMSTLRPFLSFSVPTMREGFQGLSFDAVNWPQLTQMVLQQQQQQQSSTQAAPTTPAARYDTATIALEGSKLAANQINACFSVFNARPKVSPSQCIYGGAFLGAEQILVGDAIRVDAPVEGAAGAGAATGAASSADPTSPAPGTGPVEIMRVSLVMTDDGHLRFIGDVYRLVQTLEPIAVEDQPIGDVFAEEVAERNRVSGSQGQVQGLWSWHLTERNGQRSERQVHGRFYASTRLATNLQNAAFLADAGAGRIGDGMLGALNRRTLVEGFWFEGQRVGRAATIGAAISVALPGIEGVKE